MKEFQLDLSELTGSLSLQTRAANRRADLGGEGSRAPQRARARPVQDARASAGPGRIERPAAEVEMEGEGQPKHRTSCATGGESVEREARGPGAS